MAKVIIVEDDSEIAAFTALELRHEGYEVATAADGREGLALIANEKPDIVLLDVMLPRLSGIEVLRKMRGELGISTPVIFVTARGETIDKVDALNSGADDYITKPFQIEELLARLSAVLRRTAPALENQAAAVLKNGGIELNTESMSLSVKGKSVPLTKVEYLLLKMFMENIGIVLSRDSIEENIVDVYVRHLRAKAGNECIATVRGAGYVMQEAR